MRLLIQRVSSASVVVRGETVGAISQGLLAFLGITHTDSLVEVEFLAKKLAHLRIFEDEEGKLNRSVEDVNGEVLIVSQFTLYGDCQKGRRPSFIEAARPEKATPLYEAFIQELKSQRLRVATGIFGADMKVSLVNDGPVTLLLEKEGDGR